MKISAFIGLGILLAGSAHAGSWSDLWYRRDQQGEQALQAGDSKRAAELFTDPRRQAYAELQAEQNDAAAKRLAPFDDGASQYNRGNALAKSGDLQGALADYDASLKHADLEAPLRRDAQHNRDLVARQLQAQKNQQHPSSGAQSPSKDQQNGKPKGDESKDESKSASGASGSASPPRGSEQKSAGAEPGSSPPAPPSENDSRDGQREGNESRPSGKDRDASAPERSQEPAAAQQTGSGSQNGTERPNAHDKAIGDSSPPKTEQQLALEQWLRQIPDDPGGLLRRKFMIEHLMKQGQVPP